MRAPMIPGKKPDDNDQREAMLRRLGIAEEKPRTSSRWDVLARDMEPAPPVQTRPPVVEEAPVEEPLPAHQPIPMTAEALRAEPAPAAPAPEPVVVQAPIQPVAREPEPAPEPVVVEAPIQPLARQPEPEPVVEVPIARAPEPEPTASPINGASFMPGWGEESIPEDDEVEAFDEPEAAAEAAAPVEPVVHQPRWMDEPVAEAPRREELLPKMERPVSFTPPVAPIANDEDLDVAPEPQAMEVYAEPPTVIEPPVARAPIIEPSAPIEFPVARQPVAPPEPEPVVEAPVLRDPFTPAPEPVVEAPVARQPEPEPVAEPEPVIRRQPEPEPEPVVDVRRHPAPEPQPAPAAPPVDAALQEMRAELEAMRKQFQTAPQPQPQPAASIAAAIPYDGRRSSKNKTDFFANARMVIWTLGIVAALWVAFHALQASSQHQAKEPDHILATVTGKDGAAADKADQNNDN